MNTADFDVGRLLTALSKRVEDRAGGRVETEYAQCSLHTSEQVDLQVSEKAWKEEAEQLYYTAKSSSVSCEKNYLEDDEIDNSVGDFFCCCSLSAQRCSWGRWKQRLNVFSGCSSKVHEVNSVQ